MTEDYSEYHALRESGHTAEQVFLKARENGIDTIEQIRLIRQVFGLSLADAKQVSHRANSPDFSLDQLQERIASELEANGGSL